MGNIEKRTMTIHFVNGKEIKFEFPPKEDQYSIGALIQEALKANQILLELEDRAVFIPFQNVQQVEISPPPQKMPPITIRNAVQVS